MVRAMLLILLAAAISGCASGAILGQNHADKPGASYISVSLSDRERVFLKPMDAPGKDYIRLQFPGIWVTGGWFMVEYFCDSPKNHPDRIIIDENGEDDSVHINGNRWYSLACDDDAPFVLHIINQGDVADQR